MIDDSGVNPSVSVVHYAVSGAQGLAPLIRYPIIVGYEVGDYTGAGNKTIRLAIRQLIANYANNLGGDGNYLAIREAQMTAMTYLTTFRDVTL